MTEEEKRKTFEEFKKTEPEQEDPWTEEEILKAAKRIIRRLGIEGELQ